MKRIAFAASRTEVAKFSAEWNDDYTEITLRGIATVNLCLMPVLFNGLLSKANHILAKLTIRHSANFPASVAPHQIIDDPSNVTPGYSFIGDHALELWPLRKRNLEAFIADAKNTQRILTVNGQASEWHPSREAMKEFMDLAVELNGIFLVLFHLGGGPPSRATELFTMMYRNSSSAKRTLFAPGGKLSWVLAYSKVSVT